MTPQQWQWCPTAGCRQKRRCPDSPLLGPEQPARQACPLSCVGRVACGQSGGGGSEKQLRRFVSDSALRRYPAERGVGLSRRFSSQPSGQQRRAAVDGEFGDDLAERVVAVPGFIEVGERLGKVAAAQSRQPAIVPSIGVLEFLPVGCEQFFGTGEVCACPPGEAEPEKNKGSQAQ